MKTIIKNIRDYIQAKIDKYVIKRFQAIFPKELVKSLYRNIAEDELLITTKIVEVKKGKIRYTLVIVKDKNLKTVFNLGRHYELEPKIVIL
jgi:hypothetical protein